MNNDYATQREIEIDFIDLIWKLLMQWKVILFVCIAMGLLVPSVKYIRDKNAYEIELAKRKEAAAQASRPAEDRIEDALSSLSVDQRDDVLYLARQQEILSSMEEHLSNSILFNLDPSNQRRLTINYVLSSDTGANMRALADSYSACLRQHVFLEKLRNLINPDAKVEYIYELIDTENERLVGDEARGALYSVTIVLPEDVDSSKVIDLVSTELYSHHSKIEAVAGVHTITNSDYSDIHVYNDEAVEEQHNYLYSINNIKSNIENTLRVLTSEQLAAYETILSTKGITTAGQNGATQVSGNYDASLSPVFSIKYAVAGFLLGVILYAGIYAVILIFKNTIPSASIARNFTSRRLLGEVYQVKEAKGISKLFTSNIIVKCRYRNQLDKDKQISAIATAIDAVCSHFSIDRLVLFLVGIGDEFDGVVNQISIRSISSDKKNRLVLFDSSNINEKEISSENSAVYLVCNKTKTSDLRNLMSLVDSYNITSYGIVYVEELYMNAIEKISN